MSKLFVIRAFGMAGAIATSIASALSGDYVTAVGILSAAFGSSHVLVGERK